jgi:hypothetical protein
MSENRFCPRIAPLASGNGAWQSANGKNVGVSRCNQDGRKLLGILSNEAANLPRQDLQRNGHTVRHRTLPQWLGMQNSGECQRSVDVRRRPLPFYGVLTYFHS